MKPKSLFRRSALTTAITVVLSSVSLSAASLYWDGTDTTADADGGAGTWNSTNTNWDDAATAGVSVAWTDGSDAVFGGTGAAVVVGAISPLSITINSSGYSFTTGTITLAASSINTGANDVAISANLAGAGSLTKSGTGTLSLTGAKTYTGGTTINANGGAITLNTGGSAGTLRGPVTVNSGGLVTAAVSDSLGYTPTTQVTPLTLNGGTFNNATNANQGYSTNVVLTGGSITSTGGGSFNFNTGYGITSNASPTTSTVSKILIRTSGTNLPIAVAAGTTTSGVDLLVDGVISQDANASITKTGLGLLALSAANTYSGTTTVSAGTLRLSNTLALQNSTLANAATISFDSAVGSHAFTLGGLSGAGNIALTDNATPTANAVALSIGNNNAATTYSGILSGTGSLTKIGTGNSTLSGVNTFSGGTTVNTGTLTLGVGGASGAIRGTVNVSSGATLAYTAANAGGYSTGVKLVTVNLNGGTLNNTAVGDNGWGTTFNLTGAVMQSNGGTSNAGSTQLFSLGQDVGGTSTSINSLASSTTSVVAGRLQIRQNNPGNSVPFNVADGAALTDLRVSASITQDIAGYGITKTGTGLIELTGASTFTGNTTINEGTLRLARSGTLASPVVVNGGRLDIPVAGKTLAAVTANTGSTLDLPAVTGTTTTVTGALVLTNGATINVAPRIGNVGLGTYDLITAGSITGTGTPVFSPTSSFGTSRITGSVAVVGNKLQFTLTGLGANLVWNNFSAAGAVAGTWDNTLTNFNNAGNNEAFQAFDAVTFDDTISGAKTITVAGAIAPSLLTINSTGNYTFNSATALSGILGGAGSILKSGSSTATLGANLGYEMTGDVTVSGGILDFGAKTFNAGKITLTGGALNNATIAPTSLDLQSGSASAAFTGAATWTKTTGNTVTLTGVGSLSGAGTLSAGTLAIGSAASPAALSALGTGSLTMSSGTTLSLVRNSTTGMTIANSISGPGAIQLNGNNTGGTSTLSSMQFTGNNSGFTGTFSVNNARLTVVNNPNALGNAPVTLVGNAQVLISGASVFPNALTISGLGWGETAGLLGALRLESGATLSGPVTMTGNSRITTYNSNATISGAIGESGGSRTLQLGAGGITTNITLSGANTYTGATTVTSATLNLTGSLAGTAVAVDTGSTIGGTGSIGSGGSLTFANLTNLNANPANSGLTVNGPVTLNGTTTVNLASGGAVSPSGIITLLNYTGGITGTSVNLALANQANYRQAVFTVGASSITLDIGGKAITWNGTSGGQWTIGTNTRWNTTGSGETDIYYQGDSVTFDETGVATAIALTGVIQPNAIVVDSTTKNYTFTTTATSYLAGNASLTKNGSSTLTLTGAANTYAGGTIVNGGTLALGFGGPAGAIRGPLTINSGATVTATVTDALGYTVGSQVTTMTINGGTFNNATNGNQSYATNVVMTGGSLTSTGGGMFYFNNGYGITTNASSTTALISSPVNAASTNMLPVAVAAGTTPSGIDLNMTGVISVYGLAKSGSGTLRLGAANTYTAGTTVSAGTLLVANTTGSGTGTGAVSVASGATLAGNGSISGAVTSAGTVSPGSSSIATLSLGATTLTGTYACDVGASSADRITVTGNLNVGGGTLALSPVGAVAETYVLASYTGTLTGTLNVTGLPSGYEIVYNNAGKQIELHKLAAGFAAWAAGFPGLADSTPGGDPDHDGLKNLVEYVLGGNPGVSGFSIIPDQARVGGDLKFHYKRNDDSKTDTTQIVQWSTDLGVNDPWHDIAIPAASAGVVEIVDHGSAPDDVTVTIPLADPKMFVRLKVTQP